MAGLADPEAVLRNIPASAVITPPSRLNAGQTSTVQPVPSKPELWDCPKCHTTNPPMSEHCFKCGTQLLRVCPECNEKTSLITTNICGKCGADYNVAFQRKGLQQKILAYTMEDGELSHQFENAKEKPMGCFNAFMGVTMVALFIGSLFSFADYPEAGIIFLILGLLALVTMIITNTNVSNKSKKMVLEYEQKLSKNREELNRVQQAYDQLTKNS